MSDIQSAHSMPAQPPEQTRQAVLAFVCGRIQELGRVGQAAEIAALRIDDTGIDSLELTELVMEIEDQFEVVVDDQNLSGEMTIQQLCDSALMQTSI